jgi:ATP/maltotriose-dependent transcriptional regulator MalT
MTGDAGPVRALEEMLPLAGLYDVIRLRPLGLLALSQGDASAAHRHYRCALELLERGGMREPAVFRIHADAAESAIAASDLDEAVRVNEALRAHARRSLIPWNRMAAARCGALIAAAQGERERADREIRKALVENQRVPSRSGASPNSLHPA